MESELEDKRLEKTYYDLLPHLKEAKERLSDLITQAVSEIKDDDLVRFRVRGLRIKEFPSFKKKVRLHGFSYDDAFSEINDLVGIRIVCNNNDDVYRVYEVLVELLGHEIIDCENFLKNPQSSGYRAIHINIFIEVGELFCRRKIRCEIQIRTLLQDSWAELTHKDVYKSDASLPDDLKGRMEDLALILSSADEIAQQVRRRISRNFDITGPIDLNRVTSEGLAHIFTQVFGRLPSQYFIQKCLEQCEESDLKTLHDLEKIEEKISFRDEARETYKLAGGFRSSPAAGLIFLAGIVATGQDEEAGFRYIKTIAHQEREDINATWRHEVLSELPETIEEFIDEVKNLNIEEIAEAWDIARSCAVCGTRIIDPEVLCDRIADHYEVDDTVEIDRILNELDLEWADRNLCSYHSYVAEKNRDD